ncbi:MAG TPA: glycosyltransferase, partial [Thermodesulfobacteriota bacterium]|nr:glycosyltransferase [Thermodesulfobacteriota bacterium]
MTRSRPALSVVVPLRDEAESLPVLGAALAAVLDRLGRPAEVILVDDGSRDGTGAVADALHRADPRFVVVALRGGHGQTAALAAGFAYARGGVIVTMDGDLQNDPADLPRLLARLEGLDPDRGEPHPDGPADVVSGWRRQRRDRLLSRRLPSWIGNRLIGWLTGVRLHDYGCALKAYRAEVVRRLTLAGDMHRYLPAQAAAAGARVAELPVAHHPRCFGRTKYGLSRAWRVLIDLVMLLCLIRTGLAPGVAFGAAARTAAVAAAGLAVAGMLRGAEVPVVPAGVAMLVGWLAVSLFLYRLLAEAI